MIYKKTWISCLLWAVFTCVTGVLLADYTISFWIQKADAAVGAGTVVLIAVVFILAVLGCNLLREIYDKTADRYKVNARKINIIENLAFFIIFAAGSIYRIVLCLHCGADMAAESSYFELAAVTAGKTTVNLIKSIDDLYIICLSFVLSFLGNKLIAGVWLQIFLQALTVILGFFTIRRLAGKIPAYAAMLFLAFSPSYTGLIFHMTPEVFSFSVFLLALFIIGGYIKNYCSDAYSVQGLIFFTVLCGCVIGVLIYLDALFMTLFVIPAGLAGAVCTKEEDAIAYKALPVFLFILIVSTAGIVLMGFFAFEAYFFGGTVASSAQSWISSYVQGSVYVSPVAEMSVIEYLILLFLASFLIMSFWFRPKVQNASPWIVLMLLFGPPHITSEIPGHRIYSLFIWSVLAGIGLQQCLTQKKTIARAIDPETEPMEVETKMTLTEGTETPETPQLQETPAKPRFIENPLPLPKKHEKRSLEYQYEVDEEKLEFDIEIAENDDFDV